MVIDTHMHDHNPPTPSPSSSTARTTIKKRKRMSDQHLPSAPSLAQHQQRRHQRKSSLNDRVFSINTRPRSLDFAVARPPVDSNTSRCCDWVLQRGGAHYSRNRSWFGPDYRAVNVVLGGGLWCQGVGSVQVDVMTGAGGSGWCSVLLLDVLHVPKAVCNGMSLALLPHLQGLEGGAEGLRDARTGEVIFVKNFRGLRKLALLGDPVGESPLEELVEDDVPANLLDLELRLNDTDVARIKEVVALGA